MRLTCSCRKKVRECQQGGTAPAPLLHKARSLLPSPSTEPAEIQEHPPPPKKNLSYLMHEVQSCRRLITKCN